VAGLPGLLRDAHRAAWVMPKKYIEKVGEEGFKK
jgi:hypothetical protein